jgi:hypothetical protein
VDISLLQPTNSAQGKEEGKKMISKIEFQCKRRIGSGFFQWMATIAFFGSKTLKK